MNVWLRILILFPILFIFSALFYGAVFLIFPELYSASRTEYELLMSTNFSILFLTQIALLLGTISSILFVSKIINKESPLFLKSMMNIKGLLVGIFLGIFLILLTVTLMSFFNPLKIRYQGFDIRSFFYLVIFFIVAISEEMLSRGYIFYNLFSSINKLFAILSSSLIFALMHVFNSSLNTVGFINLILAGILFTLLYLSKMNLSIPIGIHFSWNFFLGPVLGFSVSGFVTNSVFKTEYASGKVFSFQGFGLEGSFFLTLIIIPFIIYFFSLVST
jgi:membrane protease YdiL (CAAX protease family)